MVQPELLAVSQIGQYTSIATNPNFGDASFLGRHPGQRHRERKSASSGTPGSTWLVVTVVRLWSIRPTSITCTARTSGSPPTASPTAGTFFFANQSIAGRNQPQAIARTSTSRG